MNNFRTLLSPFARECYKTRESGRCHQNFFQSSANVLERLVKGDRSSSNLLCAQNEVSISCFLVKSASVSFNFLFKLLPCLLPEIISEVFTFLTYCSKA